MLCCNCAEDKIRVNNFYRPHYLKYSEGLSLNILNSLPCLLLHSWAMLKFKYLAYLSIFILTLYIHVSDIKYVSNVGLSWPHCKSETYIIRISFSLTPSKSNQRQYIKISAYLSLPFSVVVLNVREFLPKLSDHIYSVFTANQFLCQYVILCLEMWGKVSGLKFRACIPSPQYLPAPSTSWNSYDFSVSFMEAVKRAKIIVKTLSLSTAA